MLAFGNAVLLRRVGTRHTMRDPRALEIGMETVILAAPIGLHGADFSIQETLNMFLKIIEHLLNIRFVFNQIYPTMAAIVINKTNVVFITSRRRHGRSPNIGVNKLKRRVRNMSRRIIR